MQPLEHFMYRRWAGGQSVRAWCQRVAAANSLIERAVDEHLSTFGPLWNDLAGSPGNLNTDTQRLAMVAWRTPGADTPDARFRPLRELYLALYEASYRTDAAVFVVADSLLGDRDASKLVDADGKVHAAELQKLETRRDLPPGLLTDGFNHHIRNSISHSRFEVLSIDEIKMWDRRPGGRGFSWGPEVLTHTELHSLVFDFLSTCEALVAAKIFFDVNNGGMLRDRGYLVSGPRRFRLDVAKQRLGFYAEMMGFECVAVEEGEGNALYAKLRVRGERVEHPEQIFAGGYGNFVVDVETHDVPIRLQLYSLVQCTWQLFETYDQGVFEVADSDDAPLGRLVVDAVHLAALRDMVFSADEFRQRLPEDSLPDDSMPVVIRSPARRI